MSTKNTEVDSRSSFVKSLGSSGKDDWRTPPHIFNWLNEEFKFTLDSCASDENHLCNAYWTEEDNALIQPWHKSTWCNPPYSIVAMFIDKAIEEAQRGNRTVLLVFARTDTQWFKRAWAAAEEVRFVSKRIQFLLNDGTPGANPPGGSAILVLGPKANGNPKVTLVDQPKQA